MDTVLLGTHKITSSSTKYVSIDIDTVTNFNLKYLYISSSSKVDQNNIRARVILGGDNIVTDGLISMNHYRTQYLDPAAYQFSHSSSAAYKPNAPLFISFVIPEFVKSMGLPISSAFTSQIKLELYFKTAPSSNTILNVYGVGGYKEKVSSYAGHFLLENNTDTLSSTAISYYKDYYISGKGVYGFGYINSSRKAFPEFHVLMDTVTLFQNLDNFPLLEQGDLPKLATKQETTVHSSASSNIDLDSFNTVTELDTKTSGQDFKSGQSLPFYANELNAQMGNNQSNKYYSSSWGYLARYSQYAPVEYNIRFGGNDYEVLPYYTKVFQTESMRVT